MPAEKIPQTLKVTPPLKKRNYFQLITLFRKTANSYKIIELGIQVFTEL